MYEGSLETRAESVHELCQRRRIESERGCREEQLLTAGKSAAEEERTDVGGGGEETGTKRGT